MPKPRFSAEQLEQLQSFLKDWLRHSGRTQADLRRALQTSSIRMPALLDALQRTYAAEGVVGVARQLCRIEARWSAEDHGLDGGTRASVEAGVAAAGDSLGQLDLLLQEIRGELHD